MKLAIGIPTYRRLDGTTPGYLTRCLESVKHQTHQDYKVFLIGDHYDNPDEFEKIATSIITEDKIYFENREQAPERNKYQIGSKQLWCAGGVSAYNHAIGCALSQGYDYICHLDHDDFWDTNHLSLINQVIEQAPQASLIYSCARHFNGSTLPSGAPIDGIVHEHIPIPANTVHSSVCINHRKIPLLYRDVFAEEGHTLEADMDMWIRVRTYLSNNPYLKSYLIRAVTCYHDIENH